DGCAGIGSVGIGIELGIDNVSVDLLDWTICSGLGACGVVTATVRPIKGSFVLLPGLVTGVLACNSLSSSLDSGTREVPLEKVFIGEEELVEVVEELDNKTKVSVLLVDDEEIEDEEDSEEYEGTTGVEIVKLLASGRCEGGISDGSKVDRILESSSGRVISSGSSLSSRVVESTLSLRGTGISLIFGSSCRSLLLFFRFRESGGAF